MKNPLVLLLLFLVLFLAGVVVVSGFLAMVGIPLHRMADPQSFSELLVAIVVGFLALMGVGAFMVLCIRLFFPKLYRKIYDE